MCTFFDNDMFIISVIETTQLLENILSIYAAGTIITEHVLKALYPIRQQR